MCLYLPCIVLSCLYLPNHLINYGLKTKTKYVNTCFVTKHINRWSTGKDQIKSNLNQTNALQTIILTPKRTLITFQTAA